MGDSLFVIAALLVQYGAPLVFPVFLIWFVANRIKSVVRTSRRRGMM